MKKGKGKGKRWRLTGFTDLRGAARGMAVDIIRFHGEGRHQSRLGRGLVPQYRKALEDSLAHFLAEAPPGVHSAMVGNTCTMVYMAPGNTITVRYTFAGDGTFTGEEE